jgi:hypothetical protein
MEGQGKVNLLLHNPLVDQQLNPLAEQMARNLSRSVQQMKMPTSKTLHHGRSPRLGIDKMRAVLMARVRRARREEGRGS